jgi:recombination protein RecT
MDKSELVAKVTTTALTEKTLADNVQNRVNELVSAGRLNLPKDYSVGNAMSSAWLILQNTVDKDKRSVLQSCAKASIANALLDMAILGLNPSKQQGYFIAYGNQLSWFTSYFGNIAAVSRVKGFESLPAATLIYKGDKIKLSHDELGEEIIAEHETSWENKVTGEIIGAYATIKFGGRLRTQVMTMNEIKEAWSMSKTNKEHKTFTGEFAKRTVLNRLMKNLLKTSTDDDLVAETLIKTENEHFEFDKSNVVQEVKTDVEENTGKEDLPFEEVEPKQDLDQKANSFFEDEPDWAKEA